MASSRERRPPPPPSFRMENPFSVKVLQVFTGFGVGCGVGIGVGGPIYLYLTLCRSSSKLNQSLVHRIRDGCGYVTWASASFECYKRCNRCFFGRHKAPQFCSKDSRVKEHRSRHWLWCWYSHGFGIGIALKPRVLHEIQSSVGEIMSKFTSRLKDTAEMTSASNPVAGSLSSTGQTNNGISMDLDAKTAERNFNPTAMGHRVQPSHVLHGQHRVPPEALTGSRTEKVISNFLQSTVPE